MQPSNATSLFNQWRQEDQDLQGRIGEDRAWMREVEQIGFPHFGEASGRLSNLRNRLVEHFNRENEIMDALGNQIGDSSPIDRLADQSESDHQLLSEKLDDLINRLNQLEPPFDSWTAAMKEIESFLGDLADHERKESTQLASLLMAGESHV